MARKYYVVWNGFHTGIYDSWEECKASVTNYPGAKYKSFSSLEEATEAYRGDPQEHLGIIRSIASHRMRTVNYEAYPDIRLDALAVDAACSRNPGPVEYRGVWVSLGIEEFRIGPLQGGTNNIGEYLAIVHALALLAKKGLPMVPVYSDSRTGMAWLRARAARTSITPSPQNLRVRELIARANTWLATHEVTNPVLKWDTDTWGEIPADFGRK